MVDEYQRQGIGAALMRHLVTIARGAGLKELIAEVLPDNAPMLKVFEKSGLRDEYGARARRRARYSCAGLSDLGLRQSRSCVPAYASSIASCAG